MKTQTPEGFRAARLELGLGARNCARLLNLGPHGERTLRNWEAGKARIHGSSAALINWLAYGSKPKLPRRAVRKKAS